MNRWTPLMACALMALSGCPSDDGIRDDRGVCGDGTQQATEACDDGNRVDEDACTNLCALARCGDGIVREGLGVGEDGLKPATTATRSMRINARPTASLQAAGTVSCARGPLRGLGWFERCDDANEDDAGACRNDCQLARCGDGMRRLDLQPGEDGAEACDDGNELRRIGALPRVFAPSCGDGFVGPGEGCDDGNDDPADGCHRCQAIPCGDGVLDEGEACDDGNLSNSDQCLNNCVH